MSRTAIAQIAKLIGRDLERGPGPARRRWLRARFWRRPVPPPKLSIGCSLKGAASARMTG